MNPYDIPELPTFDEQGSINMSNVLNAYPITFLEHGVDVVKELTFIRDQLKILDPKRFTLLMSDFIHEQINKYETEEGRNRTPGYKMTPMFCFYYNIYGLLISSLTCYHMEETEIYERDIEVLDCEIEMAKNRMLIIGRNNNYINEYKGKIITIPKGCPIYSYDEEIKSAKKNQKIKVNHIIEGYYGTKVEHARIVWAGTGGYWKYAFIRDIVEK